MVRPGDANEVACAWKTILERRENPAGIALTRQNIPVFKRGEADETGSVYASAEHTSKGAYTLVDASNSKPELIIIATGSELQLAVAARLKLEADGIKTRVVSMPCVEWFEEQSAQYKESVLPSDAKARVSVEAGLALGWSKYVGRFGESVSIEHFGASADYKTLFREFGMTTDAVIAAAHKSLSN
jgi:transketolase